MHITLNDIQPVEQVSDPSIDLLNYAKKRNIQNISRFGVTSGCFTTQAEDLPIVFNAGIPDSAQLSAAMAAMKRSVASSPQKNLSSEEVTAILTLQQKTLGLLDGMIAKAQEVGTSYQSVLPLVQSWKDCWVACGGNQKAFEDAYDSASKKLTDLGDRRFVAFKSVDLLMVFAQNEEDALAMCDAKMRAASKLNQIINDIAPLVQRIGTISGEAASGWSRALDALIGGLQAFVVLAKALVEVIKMAYKGLVAAAGILGGSIIPWILANPGLSAAIGAAGLATVVGGYGYAQYRMARTLTGI